MTLTQREQTRLQVLNSLMADHMTTEQAATLMGVSARHTRRILAAYRRDGAAALAHGNRGRRPANATSDPLATGVVVLARTRYAGVNHTHLSELLREREHPQLLTADAGSDTELRHTARTLFRSPWRLQAHAAVGDRRRSHPVLARDG